MHAVDLAPRCHLCVCTQSIVCILPWLLLCPCRIHNGDSHLVFERLCSASGLCCGSGGSLSDSVHTGVQPIDWKGPEFIEVFKFIVRKLSTRLVLSKCVRKSMTEYALWWRIA